MGRYLALATSIAFLATQALAGSQTVSRSEFGDAWPLTVEKGTLSCEGGGAVTFATNGVTYAVNGLAKSNKAFANIDPIWASGSGTPKKNIGPLIDRGLKLCNE